MRNVRGFRIPTTGENVPILPITIKVEHWDDMIANHEYDQWEWDAAENRINDTSDGIPEVFLFPNPAGNSSGNFGTVRIGSNDASNAYLTSQVNEGLNQSDLDFHGGELSFNDQGELPLGGDTGLDASLQNDLRSIAGEPRIIPLYERVVNPGHEAEYTIVKWVGIRVMSVTLTGCEKGVYVQPASVTVKGAIQGGSGQSETIYSPAQIVN